MKPYTTPSTAVWKKVRRLTVIALLGFFCFINGAVFALVAPALMLLFAAPVALLFLVAIWAAPESTAPERSLETLFFLYTIALIAWPNYVAIAIPGLPWITLIRLFGAPMVVIFLYSLSVSDVFRRRLGDAVSYIPKLLVLQFLFVGVELISIGFSHNVGESIDKFVTAQLNWTAPFLIGAWLFSKPGRAITWAGWLWALAIAVGMIAIWEDRLGHVPWAGHLPKFLQISDPTVIAIMSATGRAYSGVYRAHSVFGTPLGLAEYNAIALPFVLHFATTKWPPLVRWGAVASMLFIFYTTFLTDSRFGLISEGVTGLGFLFIWALRAFRENPQRILPRALLFTYPVLASGTVLSTFLFPRIHAMVWGGGAQAASTEARQTQWAMGIPKVISHPWGYGIGQGAETLGFTLPGGLLTIDTYFLDVALEYGVHGFILYYAIQLWTIAVATKEGVLKISKLRERALLIPISLVMVNFVLIKSVYSQQDNHTLIFILQGMVGGLLYIAVRREHGEMIDSQ